MNAKRNNGRSLSCSGFKTPAGSPWSTPSPIAPVTGRFRHGALWGFRVVIDEYQAGPNTGIRARLESRCNRLQALRTGVARATGFRTCPVNARNGFVGAKVRHLHPIDWKGKKNPPKRGKNGGNRKTAVTGFPNHRIPGPRFSMDDGPRGLPSFNSSQQPADKHRLKPNSGVVSLVELLTTI